MGNLFFAVVFLLLGFDGWAAHSDSLLEVLRRTVDKRERASIFLQLGEETITTGDYEKAKEFLKLSHKSAPTYYENNIAILLKLVQIEIREKHREKALKLLNKVASLLSRKATDKMLLDLNNMFAYYYYSYSQLDSAIRFFKKCVSYAAHLHDSAGMASNWNNVSVCYYYSGKVDSALNYAKKALAIKLNYDSLNFKGIALAYLNIASYYDILANYDKAVEYGLKAVKYAELSDDKYTQATTYNNLGSVFKHLKDYKKAVFYYEKAQEILITTDLKRMRATVYNNLGTCYIKLKAYTKAENYLFKALDLYKSLEYYSGISAAYENLGSIFLQNGDNKKAYEYFNKSLEYAYKVNDLEGIITGLLSKAKVDYARRKYHTAIKELETALDLVQKHNIRTSLLDIYRLLAKSYTQTGNTQEASTYYEQYIVTKDSIFNIEKEELANKLEVQYQTRLQEKTIKNLQQANAIKELQLKKNKQRNLFIQIFLLGIIAFVILLIRKNKIKFENKIIEFKQKLLRSQMNPHFIFNALATIQGLLIKKEYEAASRSLSKFASLMRQIIENSREEYVSLREEIDTVRNYLEIQQIRKQSFDYEILVDDDLDVDEVEVPPMLLQPFIENSIKHAFPEKNANNKIKVEIKKQREQILYEVTDNGIGVSKSLEMKRKIKTSHKSYAIEITRERLKLLYSKKKKIRFEISDLQKIDRNLHGTKVSFYLPLK